MQVDIRKVATGEGNRYERSLGVERCGLITNMPGQIEHLFQEQRP